MVRSARLRKRTRQACSAWVCLSGLCLGCGARTRLYGSEPDSERGDSDAVAEGGTPAGVRKVGSSGLGGMPSEAGGRVGLGDSNGGQGGQGLAGPGAPRSGGRHSTGAAGPSGRGGSELGGAPSVPSRGGTGRAAPPPVGPPTVRRPAQAPPPLSPALLVLVEAQALREAPAKAAPQAPGAEAAERQVSRAEQAKPWREEATQAGRARAGQWQVTRAP